MHQKYNVIVIHITVCTKTHCITSNATCSRETRQHHHKMATGASDASSQVFLEFQYPVSFNEHDLSQVRCMKVYISNIHWAVLYFKYTVMMFICTGRLPWNFHTIATLTAFLQQLQVLLKQFDMNDWTIQVHQRK